MRLSSTRFRVEIDLQESVEGPAGYVGEHAFEYTVEYAVEEHRVKISRLQPVDIASAFLIIFGINVNWGGGWSREEGSIQGLMLGLGF